MFSIKIAYDWIQTLASGIGSDCSANWATTTALRRPFPDSFYLFSSFQFSWQNVQIKFADDWIRTSDLWCQNWPLFQQNHNHCPIFLFLPATRSTKRSSSRSTTTTDSRRPIKLVPVNRAGSAICRQFYFCRFYFLNYFWGGLFFKQRAGCTIFI